eukprot:7062273-Prymnesium_polylepis.1
MNAIRSQRPHLLQTVRVVAPKDSMEVGAHPLSPHAAWPRGPRGAGDCARTHRRASGGGAGWAVGEGGWLPFACAPF